MKKITIVLSGLLLLLMGCMNYTVTAGGGVRPKRPHYKLAGAINGQSSIDTNAVYVAKISDLHDSLKNQYIFLRFFDKGKVYSSFPIDSVPDRTEFNNINSGAVGYYNVNGQVVTIELFGLFFSDYQYMVYEGNVGVDHIHIHRSRLNRLSSFEENVRYDRIEADSLSGVADW